MSPTTTLARAGLILLGLAGSVAAQNNKLTSTPANFRGFYILDNGAVSTVTCSSGATFYTSSTYGACCSTDNCNFATACNDKTATRIFGGTFTCGTDFPDCYTMTVYASYPSADQSWLIRGCATNWRASTVYREIVTETSTTKSTITPLPGSVTTDPAPGPTPPSNDDEGGSGSGEITAPPGPTPTQPVTPVASGDGGSKAWIAGAVIGPLLGIALIGVLCFWLGKRKQAGSAGAPSMSAESAMKAETSTMERSSIHPSSMYYGGGSPGMGSPMVPASSPGPYAPPHDQHSTITSTPSPVNGGYMHPAQGMYQQQPAAYSAPYPPPQQYSPQPYAAAQYSPPPPASGFVPTHNVAELASGPMSEAPQELGDGAPKQR